eukprot:g62996.t1
MAVRRTTQHPRGHVLYNISHDPDLAGYDGQEKTRQDGRTGPQGKAGKNHVAGRRAGRVFLVGQQARPGDQKHHH